MAPCNLQSKDAKISSSERRFWQTDGANDNRIHDSLHASDADVEDASCTVCGDLLAGDDLSLIDATETDRTVANDADAGSHNNSVKNNAADRSCRDERTEEVLSTGECVVFWFI